MSNERVTVEFEALLDAFEFAAMDPEHRAYISRKTGAVHCVPDHFDLDAEFPPDPDDEDELDEEIPPDLGSDDEYVPLPDKKELGLGRDLAIAFVAERLPRHHEPVRRSFRRAGAYGRFNALLGLNGKLEEWSRFEERATKAALRTWCETMDIDLGQSG